ncbi:type II inositol 3,4-bisphosphate 4-phosphatase-like [Osmerus eperlanus]|uniref:type II inositol 3,4-bisphosphate 4-phosphatase-like n=1 Tax=Osmerus eperlanus TaxID=29151 RepID=UPI002E1180AE
MISGHVSWSGCNSGREGRVLLDRETPGRPDSNNTHTSHLQQRLTDTVVNEAAHIIPLEFILECRGLVAMTAKDRVPRALVQVSVVNTHTHTLTHHCCTEIAEGSRDPVFLTGVCFHDNQAVYWDTRMKLTVYHYKDPAHNTRMFLGFTSFSIRDLFLSQEPSISLSLRTQDGVREVGEVKVSRLQMQELQDGEREDTSTCLPGHKCPLLCDCLHGSIHDTDNSPMMRAALRNTLCKVYRFQTEAGVWMLSGSR